MACAFYLEVFWEISPEGENVVKKTEKLHFSERQAGKLSSKKYFLYAPNTIQLSYCFFPGTVLKKTKLTQTFYIFHFRYYASSQCML